VDIELPALERLVGLDGFDGEHEAGDGGCEEPF
jgi:hypothetical protein